MGQSPTDTNPDEGCQTTLQAILDSVAEGDRIAVASLLPRMYDELRQLAGHQLRDQHVGHTLQPTALVNEAYLKLSGRPDLEVRDRAHFIMLASRVMRQVLIDHARIKNAAKRGKEWQRITLSGVGEASSFVDVELEVLDEALEELNRLSERKARLVELRFFGGLTETEAAVVLGISRTEATRQWRLARAWLSRRMRGDA